MGKPVTKEPTKGERVLLHACCAPCSGAVVEYVLAQGLVPTIFYSNSNIFPSDEFSIRERECCRYAGGRGIEIVLDGYAHEEWLCIVAGLEKERERGARCTECFRYRLERAARYAWEHGYSWLTTTLSSSRRKDVDEVNAAGEYACSLFPGVHWWGKNWRKGGLQERREAIIKEENFYNQTYCGCEFSIYKSK